MSHRYCTLFDRDYLSRGLAMIGSLQQHDPEARIAVYAFDRVVEEVVARLALPGIDLVTLAQFETPELLSVKAGRTKAEYCWTCTPSVIDDCISRFDLEQCTYIDADMFFFDSAQAALEEMRGASVLITEHHYAPEYDQTDTMGKYCVQFMGFRRDRHGLEALHWWRDRCLEWCYARPENGKFGDQKYLDDWPQRFTGVRVAAHLGVGVAPWNVQRYEFDVVDRKISVRDVAQRKRHRLVCFHCHGFKLFTDGTARLAGGYRISPQAVRVIYAPYLAALYRAENRVSEVMPGIDPHGRVSRPRSLRAALNELRNRLAGARNRYREQQLMSLG